MVKGFRKRVKKPREVFPVSVKLTGIGPDNHAAIPLRLIEPVIVHHVIERKPIPRPDYIRIQLMREDGSFIDYPMNVGHWYESQVITIGEGFTHFRLQYHFGDKL